MSKYGHGHQAISCEKIRASAQRQLHKSLWAAGVSDAKGRKPQGFRPGAK